MLCLFSSLLAVDTLNCIASYEFNTPMAENEFVTIVALGDINADGYDDWSLLFHDYNEFQKNDTAWIFLGSDSIDFTPDYRFRANDIAPLGDVNRDGYQDIGYLDVRTWNSIYIYKPRLYVLYGGPDFDLIPDDSCIINVEGYKVELSPIGSVGDINHDGYDDIYCGVTQKHDVWYESKQYIHFGAADISTNADIIIPPPNRKDLTGGYYSFGWCFAGLGDINNDNYDDFIIMYKDQPSEYGGKSIVYRYYGASSIDTILSNVDTLVYTDGYYKFTTTIGLDLMAEPAIFMYRSLDRMDVFNTHDSLPLLHFDNFKEASTGNGDLNNDGFNDWFILFGNPDFYKGYYGSSILDSLYDIALPNDEQPSSHNYRQLSCAFIGNVCGDGYDKLLVIESDGIHNDYTGDPDLKYRVYCYSYNKVETEIKPTIPIKYDLLNIYPNPFNPTTTINYQLFSLSNVDLSIYNVLGMKEVTLFKNTLKAGSYDVQFNAQSLGSGIYLCVLQVNNEVVDTKKLLLMK